jgi:pteridine reductase
MTHHLAIPSIPGKLHGKVALITGAGRRIGRGLAIALAEEGVNIIAHDRQVREPETIKVCGEVESCGAKAWKIIADLEKPQEYESLVARTFAIAGRVDILINNASLFQPGTLDNIGWGDVTRHMHVNAWTPFVLTREFTRLAHSGKIINLLDTKIAGFDKQHAAYILSKQTLALLTRMCALEFAPAFTVNGVAPGLILPPEGKDPGYLDQLAQTVPLKRHGGPADIADAVIYLLKSDFVTGQVLYVDGGHHLEGEGHG